MPVFEFGDHVLSDTVAQANRVRRLREANRARVELVVRQTIRIISAWKMTHDLRKWATRVSHIKWPDCPQPPSSRRSSDRRLT